MNLILLLIFTLRVDLSPLLIEYAKVGFDYGIKKVLEASEGKVDLEFNQAQSGYTPLQGICCSHFDIKSQN